MQHGGLKIRGSAAYRVHCSTMDNYVTARQDRLSVAQVRRCGRGVEAGG